MRKVLAVLFWIYRHPWISLAFAVVLYLLFGQFFSVFGMTASSVSARGKRWLKVLEGFKPRAYNDKDKEGKLTNNWTIGYGHLIKASELDLYSVELTKQQGDELFEKDLDSHFVPVRKLIAQGVKLNQAQVDALASFFFRAGVGAVEYQLIKYILKQKSNFDPKLIQDYWDNIAYSKRGQAEINLFLNGVYKETTDTTIS